MAKRKDPNEDEPKDENLNNDSDDMFGLPEIEYEPIKKKEEPEAESEQEPEAEPESAEIVSESEPEPKYEPEPEETTGAETFETYEQQQEPVAEETYQFKPYEEEPSIWPKIAAILIVIVLALGTAWYFLMYQPQQEEKKKQAQIEADRLAADKKAKEEEETRQRLAREAAEKRRLDSLEKIRNPPLGTIETLSERTGRYYVVIASAIDKDLLMDYAEKLKAKGVSSKIIPPYGKFVVSRITIAEGETFVLAQAKADELKAEYGNSLWVLKY